MNIKQKIKAYFTKENLKSEGKELIDTIVFVLVALIVIRFFIFEPRVIPSASMLPTLIEKDRLIIERFSRFFTSPQRGDIIVFYPPKEAFTPPKEPIKNGFWGVLARLTGLFCKDVAFIKRVIGTPGDNVEIKKESDETFSVYLNGEKLNEPYIKSEYEYTDCEETSVKYCKISLNEDEFFVMGDNRDNSLDSRFWGPVKKERIIGINKIRFWPLNRLAYFKKINY